MIGGAGVVVVAVLVPGAAGVSVMAVGVGCAAPPVSSASASS